MISDTEVRRRLYDYELANATAAQQRALLIETWRRHFPEAAREQSPEHHPLICAFSRRPPAKDPPVKEPDEEWHNDVYFVTVRRWQKDPVFGSNDGMIQLGIAALDGTARHDWREFQAIKNQLAGPECEAFELYPAESRVLDPSNYYTLWCFPGIKRLKIGHDKREILDAHEAYAPQRALSSSAPKAGPNHDTRAILPRPHTRQPIPKLG